MQIRSEVHQQQAVVTHLAEKTQHQALFGEHGPIHTARSLGTEDGIFAAQTQQVPMQIVGAPVAFALAEIKLAPLECRGIRRVDQAWQHLARGQTAELRQKLRSPFPHQLGEIRLVVRKIIERT